MANFLMPKNAPVADVTDGTHLSGDVTQLGAVDVARGAVSKDVCENVYGVVLAANGSADEKMTKSRRDQLRASRKSTAKKPSIEGLKWSYKGNGRTQIAEALTIDTGAKSVSCGQCGHRHCGTEDNLLDHLGLIETPPSAAGPVRGEAYERGRFKLRQFICTNCGGLAEVQVNLAGAPASFAMPDVR